MTNTYLNQLINEFDQEFESLVIPFPKSYVVNAVEVDDKKEDVITATDNFSNENQEAVDKLNKIEALATKISAERYNMSTNSILSVRFEKPLPLSISTSR